MSESPTVGDQLVMLAIVRGFVEYDDLALTTLWKTVDPEDIAIGLASYAATLVAELAEARGITPQEQIDLAVQAAVTNDNHP